MNDDENENGATAAEIVQRAQTAQQVQNTEYVKKLATSAKRLISQAPFDGAEAPEVAEVLLWLNETIKGADKQLVILGLTAQVKPVTQPPAQPIKPEVVTDDK